MQIHPFFCFPCRNSTLLLSMFPMIIPSQLILTTPHRQAEAEDQKHTLSREHPSLSHTHWKYTKLMSWWTHTHTPSHWTIVIQMQQKTVNLTFIVVHFPQMSWKVRVCMAAQEVMMCFAGKTAMCVCRKVKEPNSVILPNWWSLC